MIVHHIDHIKIAEARKRMMQRGEVLTKGVTAAEALLWFKEYGHSGLTVEARLVAGSTPNVATAQAYVKAAAESFAEQILDKAVATAKVNFELAEEAERIQREAIRKAK